MRLADLLTPIEFPAAELAALRLDGVLYPVAEVWRPTDLPETLEARAGAVALTLRDRLVADRMTAAWVLGAADVAPSPLQCCVPVEERGAAQTPHLDIREVRLQDGDVLRMGGLRLSSPLRTSIDLLGAARWEAAEKEAVTRLLGAHDRGRLMDLLEEPRFGAYRRRRMDRVASLSWP
jgi:hypothetical protein